MRNSKDVVPVRDAWKEGKLSYSTGLTLNIAKKMLDAAEEEAKKQGILMTVAIVDCGGNLVALHRMDNSFLCAIQISMDKAFTAVFGKIPTKEWADAFKSGELTSLFFHERWAAFPGGAPLIRDRLLLGGIGVSGATMFGDLSVARAAMAAGGFNTDDIDTLLS